MKEVNVVIADELVEVAEKIKNVLENMSEIRAIKIVTNEDNLYNELMKTKTDILFLDASIKDGKQVVKRIFNENKNRIPYLVYTDTEPTQPTDNNTFSNVEIGALIKPYIDEEIVKIVKKCLFKNNHKCKI